MNTTLVAIFLALGGTSLLWKFGKNYIPLVFDKLGDWLLKFPKVHKFVVGNKEDLKEILKKSEQELEKDIDSATDEEPKA